MRPDLGLDPGGLDAVDQVRPVPQRRAVQRAARIDRQAIVPGTVTWADDVRVRAAIGTRLAAVEEQVSHDGPGGRDGEPVQLGQDGVDGAPDVRVASPNRACVIGRSCPHQLGVQREGEGRLQPREGTCSFARGVRTPAHRMPCSRRRRDRRGPGVSTAWTPCRRGTAAAKSPPGPTRSRPQHRGAGSRLQQRVRQAVSAGVGSMRPAEDRPRVDPRIEEVDRDPGRRRRPRRRPVRAVGTPVRGVIRRAR